VGVLAMTQADSINELFSIIDDGKDWDRLGQVFAPNVTYFRPGYQTIRGIVAIQKFYTESRQVRIGRHHIYRILSDGCHCCCWGMFSGETKIKAKVNLYFTDWYRFSNELIVYRRTFFYQPMI
jgi:ketosteroid isomerase-like protein